MSVSKFKRSLATEKMIAHYFYESDGFWTQQFRGSPLDGEILMIVNKPSEDNWTHSNKIFSYNGKYPIGILPMYAYFGDEASTQSLLNAINKDSNDHDSGLALESLDELYQFEAHSFRYNVLLGNISHISVIICGNNRILVDKRYIIFPFGSRHDGDGERLFCLAVGIDVCGDSSTKNKNGSGYNAKWVCYSIGTAAEMVAHFQQYITLITKSGVNINNNNGFIDLALPRDIEYREYYQYGPSCDFDNIGKSSKTLEQLKSDLREKHNHGSNNGNNNNNSGNSNSESKCNNDKVNVIDSDDGFDKVKELLKIMKTMGITSIDEFIGVLEDAIDKSVEFARRHPNTVLTQVYIDGKKARKSYEPVLYCEFKDVTNGRYYKFGLPMKYNGRTKRRFEVQTILFPKMCQDNIGLNKPALRFADYRNQDKKWWFLSMNDESLSFYDYYERNNNEDSYGNERDEKADNTMENRARAASSESKTTVKEKALENGTHYSSKKMETDYRLALQNDVDINIVTNLNGNEDMNMNEDNHNDNNTMKKP